MSFYAILHDASEKRWIEFARPAEVLCGCDTESVKTILERVDFLTGSGGKWGGGVHFIRGRADIRLIPAGEKKATFPALCFAIFDDVKEIATPEPETDNNDFSIGWTGEISRQNYDDAIAAIKGHISAGDTYQVNYTFRMRRAFDASKSEALFRNMIASQRCDCGAYVRTDDFAICSASPELFFSKDGDVIKCKPMKGTAPRGLTWRGDSEMGENLHNCPKNRAENVMIVDMVRNDLGRIASPGSVKVDNVFAVECFETLWQMTSGVSAETGAGLWDIMRALFPCASITGCPQTPHDGDNRRVGDLAAKDIHRHDRIRKRPAGECSSASPSARFL